MMRKKEEVVFGKVSKTKVLRGGLEIIYCISDSSESELSLK